MCQSTVAVKSSHLDAVASTFAGIAFDAGTDVLVVGEGHGQEGHLEALLQFFDLDIGQLGIAKRREVHLKTLLSVLCCVVGQRAVVHLTLDDAIDPDEVSRLAASRWQYG